MNALSYTINHADVVEIRDHLVACDAFYQPPLSTRTDLSLYAGKLANRADRFEAWHEFQLIGLVAIYCNDPTHVAAHVSNVSIKPGFFRHGIARHLLQTALALAEKRDFSSVTLEVDAHAIAALSLYRSFGFTEVARIDGTVSMTRHLKGPQE